MLERIAELVRAKTIEGIADLRDESDRQGLRVVIELRRDAEPEVVLNQLFRYSPLQGSFGCNMLALRGGRPEVMDLKAIIATFADYLTPTSWEVPEPTILHMESPSMVSQLGAKGIGEGNCKIGRASGRERVGQ